MTTVDDDAIWSAVMVQGLRMKRFAACRSLFSLKKNSTVSPTLSTARNEDPAMDRGVVDMNVALGHHLFQIMQAEAVSQMPTHAQEDH